MKRIVKDIYDIKEGEIFYFDDGTKFRVAFNNKELERFIAVCEECENKDKIGKQVEAYNFDGLNVRFMKDYIDKVVDTNGKEVEIERTEKKQDAFDMLFEGLQIVSDLEEDITNEKNIDRAYNFAKKYTLEFLKDEKVSLEKKKEVMETFKQFEESYKETKANAKNSNSELEKFINELEEE